MVVSYCILGAYTFTNLEGDHEKEASIHKENDSKSKIFHVSRRVFCVIGINWKKILIFTFLSFQVKRNISKIREGVTDELWKLTATESVVLREENFTDSVKLKLKEFENALLKAITKDGWDGIESDEQVQWTFAGALFYSIIVITTIGK